MAAVLKGRSKTGEAHRADSDTRQRVKREAMKLLAMQGLNGVSLRGIVRAAGAANTSALHYHFRDRETLVSAIAEDLQRWYEDRALPRLGELVTTPGYAVRDVLDAAFGPIIEMFEEPSLGADAVRFTARLGWDFGHEGQLLSAAFHRKAMQATLRLLQPLLPSISADDLQFKIIACMGSIYTGLSQRSYILRSPFGASPLARKENAGHLRELLMRYVEGGLRGL